MNDRSGIELADDVDFQYLRDTHGWSTARLYINGNCHDFCLTHIFDDPLQSLCSATVVLAKGYDEAYFSWFDEPGQYQGKRILIFSKIWYNLELFKYS